MRAKYNERGYHIAKGLLPEAVTRRVLADIHLAAAQILRRHGLPIEEGLEPAILARSLKRILDLDQSLYLSLLRLASRFESVHTLTMHPGVIDVLRQLGSRVNALPCGVAIHLVAEELRIPGGYFGWHPHQDWASAQGSLDQIALWCPLMDVDSSFYPLEIIPGSHKRGVLRGDRDGAGSRGAVIQIDPELLDEGEFVPLSLERGDVAFFSGLLVHRTGLKSNRPGVRIACGTRFDNIEEDTFVERGYPCAFRLHAETGALFEGFPTQEQVQQLFESPTPDAQA